MTEDEQQQWITWARAYLQDPLACVNMMHEALSILVELGVATHEEIEHFESIGKMLW